MEIIIYDQQGNQISLKEDTKDVCVCFLDDKGNATGALGPITQKEFMRMLEIWKNPEGGKVFKTKGGPRPLFRKG